jgi:4-hydroxybenzoate polyprenyltransferase
MTLQRTVPANGRHHRHAIGSQLSAFLMIVRIRSCLAGAVATVIGCYLGTGTILTAPARSVAAAIAIAAAIAFANVVNDVADVAVDALGKPARPLPAGRISMPAARATAIGATLVAMISTAPLGSLLVAGMAVLLVISFLYSAFWKGTVIVGNVVVAACASSPLVFGAAATNQIAAPVLLATLLSFEFMFSYEVLKTSADRVGDAAAGLRTLATTTGFRSSQRMFLVVCGALTATVFSAVSVSGHPIIYLAVAVPLLATPVWYVAYRLHRGHPEMDIWNLMRVMRRTWLLGTFALLALR